MGPLSHTLTQWHGIDDKYGLDNAVDVLAYFLGQYSTWKGEVARRVKTEIKGVPAMHEGTVARQRKAG